MNIHDFVARVRDGRDRLGVLKVAWRKIQTLRLPVPRPLAGMVYGARILTGMVWPTLMKILYREPLFRYRCEEVGTGLQIEGPLPVIMGNGTIRVGNNVRLDGRNTWVVGSKVSPHAELFIGDNTYIGYRVTISAAVRVHIGSNVLLASDIMVFDNPSHPLDPDLRLKGEPYRLQDCAAVHIEDNAWLASGVIVLPGVTIGANSVVGAGSVVTRSIPENCLAAGNPARVLRRLDDSGPPSGAQGEPAREPSANGPSAVED